jgi:hypothetical protein
MAQEKDYFESNGLLYLWTRLKQIFYRKPSGGIPASDLTEAVQTSLGKADTAVQDVSGKADKVSGGTNNNFAALDANGNLKDSGKKASDFQTPQTTLAGYGITDAYTKAEVDAKTSAAYKPAGSAASLSELGSLTAANLNKLYDMSAAFTTTSDFKDYATQGAKTFPAGTQVAIINTGTEQNPVYKYDTLSGLQDLSAYQLSADLVPITNEEIDDILAS